jgi:hypothetical protein
MAARYSDSEIGDFLVERKTVPSDYEHKIQLRSKRGHKEGCLDIIGANDSSFRLILRQSDINVLDFSVILAILPPDTNQLFRLRRYNGKSHEHTNHIEKKTFYDFHIHMATERYQEYGTSEDAYAELTDRYSDYQGALRCMFENCGFDVPDDPQLRLFEDV